MNKTRYHDGIVESVATGQSRASLIITESGQPGICEACGDAVKFLTPSMQKKYGSIAARVVCNVYNVEGKWDHGEVYHPECYLGAGEPYGEPLVAPAQQAKVAAVKLDALRTEL